MVALYSQMLQRKYRDRLDNQANEFIAYTVQGASRLEMLVKDLLAYTQAANFGTDDVVAACREVTGIKGWGETSADGEFTMTEVECVGGCVNAPIIQVNDDFYEDLDGERTKQLLAALRRGVPPKPGSMTGRQTSAPEGGATTLTTLQFAPES